MFWLGVALLCCGPVLALAAFVVIHISVLRHYLPLMVRIFQEKPLFIVPRGKELDGAESVEFLNNNAQILKGCYLHCQGPRRGVILFGLEFGSDRWSCRHYCEHLLAAGFDVFAYEPRSQGESDPQPGYEPLQWVTDYEVADARAAIAYLKARPDADPHGVGFFGISKGAGAMVVAAARDPYVRCFVTDGMFASLGTAVPYMYQWFRIYNTHFPIQLIPQWYLRLVARIGLRQIARARRCRFPSLEDAIKKLAPRPLFLIHGEADTYIKPEMARALWNAAGEPREFWLVPGAKHNQALSTAGEEYRSRILAFFELHLATGPLIRASSVPTEVRVREMVVQSA